MTQGRVTATDIIRLSLRNSLYITQGGQRARSYINLDVGLFGDDEMPRDFQRQSDVMETLTDLLSQKICEIAKEKNADRLAFIDKGGQGPVGVLSLASLIVVNSKIEGLLVRPYRKARRATIRGRSIVEGEGILIVSDVATTGRTILSAAEVLRSRGGKVRSALVVYDQGTGARENLASKGIQLSCIKDKKTIEESDDDELKEMLAPPTHAYIEYGATT